MNGLPPEDQAPAPSASLGPVGIVADAGRLPFALVALEPHDGLMTVLLRGDGRMCQHSVVELLRELADVVARAQVQSGAGPHEPFRHGRVLVSLASPGDGS